LYNILKILSKAGMTAVALSFLGTSGLDASWNDPYSGAKSAANTFYSTFSERPKHLDPARSYSSDEYVFIAQIYEPPLQYHYLKRPYTLIPLSSDRMPKIRYLDEYGRDLPDNAAAQDVAFSVYEFNIRRGVLFQPHPALATHAAGSYRYHELNAADLENLHSLTDFEYTGARELTAHDFVYQIKRIADPTTHSPIAGLMAQYIVGFSELRDVLKQAYDENIHAGFVDLRKYTLRGAKVIDRYTYRVRIEGKYPQFLFWQAMPFFAPIPWEAEKFYSQSGMEAKNITLDWYPIGTGPFYLAENNPNLRMVMQRNPNFHGEAFPSTGEPGDEELGLLQDAGEPLPFIDLAVYNLEKEAIPRWNKFLQGYYDDSGISSDSFDQAVQFNNLGAPGLAGSLREQGISLSTSVETSMYYMGFNMLDEVIGGDGDAARKLRRAISIAVDFEEFVSIFVNGRGLVAQGPIPPGIFGARAGEAGINPHIYEWDNDKPVRKTLDTARQLMREAGYAGGVEQASGEPLILHFEAVSRGPDDKARLNWMRKQFNKLGIQLIVRATDYNRFREKMLKGTGEIFFWGWNADYPDPENFLFLLYGPNSKARHNGENASNYQNPLFDELFVKMKNMDNGPRRQALIDEMVDIVRRDAPWMWGFFPRKFSLHHRWVHNIKPSTMANNTLKYTRIEPAVRQASRERWNEPVLWPLAVFAGLLGLSIIPAVVSFRRRENEAAI
jgi:oligopeptide transport system substrate-binding protein